MWYWYAGDHLFSSLWSIMTSQMIIFSSSCGTEFLMSLLILVFLQSKIFFSHPELENSRIYFFIILVYFAFVLLGLWSAKLWDISHELRPSAVIALLITHNPFPSCLTSSFVCVLRAWWNWISMDVPNLVIWHCIHQMLVLRDSFCCLVCSRLFCVAFGKWPSCL